MTRVSLCLLVLGTADMVRWSPEPVSIRRIVRLVLQASDTHFEHAEASLKGGRILGAMERIFVGAMILAGNVAAAAALIAAKGLLRLPEIRNSADHRRGAPDQVTEYFLIGTFASLLIAGALSALVLAGR